jgi:hypothetical protein
MVSVSSSYKEHTIIIVSEHKSIKMRTAGTNYIFDAVQQKIKHDIQPPAL